MAKDKFREVVNQSVYVQYLMRLMEEEVYAGLHTKKSLKNHKKKIIDELNKFVKMVNKGGW